MTVKRPPAIDAPDAGNDLLNAKAFPPFAALRAFEAVGRLGGIRRAAAALTLDHTVVSRHVRALEIWLGTSLFLRDQGRLSFTQAGESYHQTVSRALIDLASATKQLVHGNDPNFLRLWSVPGFTAQWLTEQLAEFARLSPDLTIELRPTDEPADLALQEADIDIRFYGDDWQPSPGGRGLRFIELASPKIMMVASPALAASLSGLQGVDQIFDVPLLHEEHHEQWRAWFTHNGVEPGEVMTVAARSAVVRHRPDCSHGVARASSRVHINHCGKVSQPSDITSKLDRPTSFRYRFETAAWQWARCARDSSGLRWNMMFHN
jgi:DNA-binding transcriptional LysR family regulator